MKLNSTPLNSPCATPALVGPRHSSPTFCQSASVGDPLPTPGILRIVRLRSACAQALSATAPSTDTPPSAAAPIPAAPLSTPRRLAAAPRLRSSPLAVIVKPPLFATPRRRPPDAAEPAPLPRPGQSGQAGKDGRRPAPTPAAAADRRSASCQGVRAPAPPPPERGSRERPILQGAARRARALVQPVRQRPESPHGRARGRAYVLEPVGVRGQVVELVLARVRVEDVRVLQGHHAAPGRHLGRLVMVVGRHGPARPAAPAEQRHEAAPVHRAGLGAGPRRDGGARSALSTRASIVLPASIPGPAIASGMRSDWSYSQPLP